MTTFSTASNSLARRAITILGAGHIGFAMAPLLQQSGDYDIVVADRDPLRLAEVAALGISTRLITDDASLQAAIDGRFAVLNALPFHRAVPVATLCASAGVHYFDLTEDVASTQAIRALAANARSVLMPQCGLAPGFVSVAAHELTRGFDKLEREHFDALAAVNGFARVAVFVDEAVRRPGEIVLQRVGGELR